MQRLETRSSKQHPDRKSSENSCRAKARMIGGQVVDVRSTGCTNIRRTSCVYLWVKTGGALIEASE